MKRTREEEEEEEYWRDLETANEIMARLGDGVSAHDEHEKQLLISKGWKAVRIMLQEELGQRKPDDSGEYSPFPKGKTRRRRDLTKSQGEALERLLGLEHLWTYQYHGHEQGKVMMKYDLTGQGLPFTRESLTLWLDESAHVSLFMPKIELANETLGSLDDPSGQGVGGETFSTIHAGFRAIRELLYESFNYKESNYTTDEGKLVVAKEELSETQLDILSRLAAMKYLWLFAGYSYHLLPNALRDIGIPLDFSGRKLFQNNTSVQKSLREFLVDRDGE